MEALTLTVAGDWDDADVQARLVWQVQRCLVTGRPLRIDPDLSESLQNELQILIYHTAFHYPDSDYAYFWNEQDSDGSVTYIPSRVIKQEKWFDE